MRTDSRINVFHRSRVAPFHDTFLRLATAVLVFDGNKIIDCNKAALEFWMAPDQESLLSKEGSQLIYTTKSSDAFFRSLLNNCIELESYKTEVLIQDFKGKIIHCQVSLISWADQVQEPIIYSIWTALSPQSIADCKEMGSASVGSENVKSKSKSSEYEIKNLPAVNIGLTADRYGIVELNIKNQVIVFEKKICEFLSIFNTNISDNSFIISTQDFVNKYVNMPDKQRLSERLDKLKMYSNLNSSTRNKIDFTLINDLGQIRNVRMLLKPIIDEEGNLKKYHGVLQDYTEQDYYQEKVSRYKSNLEILVKKRTQQLSRSQANLSDALDFANLSIWEFDTQYQVFKVSGKMFQSSKPNGQELRDKILSISDVENLLVEDDWLAFKDRIDYLSSEAIDGHTEYLEIRTKPTGKYFRHYHLNAKCTSDGYEVRKVYGTIQDITQIKHTQDENQRLIEMVEASDDIIIVANKEIEVEYINEAGKYFLGAELQEFNKKEKYLEILHSVRNGVIEAMRMGTWKGEATIARYDGYMVPFSVQVIAHTSNRQIKFISAVFRDLVKQKKIEKDLLKKNKDLDTFLYRTSHDFRAPITTLLGLGRIAKWDVKDKVAIKYLNMFEEQFDRLQRLNINISRLISINETNVFDGSKVVIYTKPLVEGIISELGLKHDVSAIRFDTEACQIIEYWPKGFDMLSIAINNLIENAIQFRKIDPLHTVNIRVESVSQYNSLIIRVSDNGIGIPLEVQKHIFDMFYRGNEKSKGFGLGLFKAKKIIEKLEGSLTVESVYQEGSTFTIKLPLTV